MLFLKAFCAVHTMGLTCLWSSSWVNSTKKAHSALLCGHFPNFWYHIKIFHNSNILSTLLIFCQFRYIKFQKNSYSTKSGENPLHCATEGVKINNSRLSPFVFCQGLQTFSECNRIESFETKSFSPKEYWVGNWLMRHAKICIQSFFFASFLLLCYNL